MGCTSSLEVKSAKVGSAPIDDVIGDKIIHKAVDNSYIHPQLALTAREVFKLQSSWKAISRNMTTTGMEFFVELFQSRSDLITMFKFGDMGPSMNLRDNEALVEHAERVMAVIDAAIKGIRDVEKIQKVLRDLAVDHRSISNFYAEIFKVIEVPFLSALQQILGDRYSDNMAKIYAVVVQFVIDNMVYGFNEGNDAAEVF